MERDIHCMGLVHIILDLLTSEKPESNEDPKLTVSFRCGKLASLTSTLPVADVNKEMASLIPECL